MSGGLPSQDPTRKDLMQMIRDLQKAVARLEARTSHEPRRHPRMDRIVFSHPGEPVAAAQSPAHCFDQPVGYLCSVKMTLVEPATGPTVVKVVRSRNGTLVDLAEVTLPTGDRFTVEDDLMMDVDELDLIYVETVTANGGTGLTLTLGLMEGED